MDIDNGTGVAQPPQIPDIHTLRFPWRNVRWQIEVEVIWEEGNEPNLLSASVQHADWDRPDGGWAPLNPMEVTALFKSDRQEGEFKLRTVEALWEQVHSRRN